MRQVEFIPFWLTDEAEIYTIRIGEKSDSETHEFIMMFKDSVNPELKDDFARIFQTLKNISVNGAAEKVPSDTCRSCNYFWIVAGFFVPLCH